MAKILFITLLIIGILLISFGIQLIPAVFIMSAFAGASPSQKDIFNLIKLGLKLIIPGIILIIISVYLRKKYDI